MFSFLRFQRGKTLPEAFTGSLALPIPYNPTPLKKKLFRIQPSSLVFYLNNSLTMNLHQCIQVWKKLIDLLFKHHVHFQHWLIKHLKSKQTHRFTKYTCSHTVMSGHAFTVTWFSRTMAKILEVSCHSIAQQLLSLIHIWRCRRS